MATETAATNVIIMGAAGRDFHDFNVYWKNQLDVEVVCFTATQIPNIDGRTYPAALAGGLYPNGIPIHSEDELESLIGRHDVELVLFSYSDVSHEYVMHQAARINAAGAHFQLAGAEQTMLRSKKPVIAVCAVRTGCGKSQTSRKVTELLAAMGFKTGVLRHPIGPFGMMDEIGLDTVWHITNYWAEKLNDRQAKSNAAFLASTTDKSGQRPSVSTRDLPFS